MSNTIYDNLCKLSNNYGRKVDFTTFDIHKQQQVTDGNRFLLGKNLCKN